MNWLTINLWIIITYIFDIFNIITKFWILIIQIKKLFTAQFVFFFMLKNQ